MSNYLRLERRTFTRGDTATPLAVEVGDENGPWDLTGAVVHFYYFNRLDNTAYSKVLTADADQVTNKGKASGTWTLNEITVSAGNYPSQVTVTFASGIKFSPSKDFEPITFQEPVYSDVVAGSGSGESGPEGTVYEYEAGVGNPEEVADPNTTVFLDETPGRERLLVKKADGTWLTIAGVVSFVLVLLSLVFDTRADVLGFGGQQVVTRDKVESTAYPTGWSGNTNPPTKNAVLGALNSLSNNIVSQIIPPSDTAYNAISWNGDTNAPTKNVVRDEFEYILTLIPSFSSLTPGFVPYWNGTSFADSLWYRRAANVIANGSYTLLGTTNATPFGTYQIPLAIQGDAGRPTFQIYANQSGSDTAVSWYLVRTNGAQQPAFYVTGFSDGATLPGNAKLGYFENLANTTNNSNQIDSPIATTFGNIALYGLASPNILPNQMTMGVYGRSDGTGGTNSWNVGVGALVQDPQSSSTNAALHARVKGDNGRRVGALVEVLASSDSGKVNIPESVALLLETGASGLSPLKATSGRGGTTLFYIDPVSGWTGTGANIFADDGKVYPPSHFGSSVFANGSSVASPNFQDSATATIVVSASTNVTVNVTNVSNAQISASANISESKLDSALTRDTEWNTIAKIETATGVNIIVSTEIDTVAEIEALTGANLIVSTEIDTSSEIAALVTDETGSGALVFGTSPTIVTPTIASFANATHSHQNAAGGGTLDGAAIASGTIAKARGGTGADNSSVTFPSSGTIPVRTDLDTSAEIAALVTDETGSGSLVFGTSPTITTPTINGGNTAPIALGSGTSFAIDPNYRVYTATASGNVTLNLATNSVSAGVALRTPIYLYLYDGTGSRTVTRSSSGTGGTAFTGGETCFGWGTNSATAGTNVYILDWDGAIWHFDQLSALIPAVQVQYMSGVNSTVLTDISTNSVTNKTFDAAATGNVLKFNDRMPFVGPWRVDGTGCTVGTTNTASYNGKAIFSSSSATNANYALYHPDAFVPTDLDSSVAMTLKLAIAIGSTDTTSETFTVGYYQPASGSVFAPSDYTALSGYISFTTGTLTSAAANKIYYVTVTLTGWAAALTPDRELWIGIARAGTANANQMFVVGGCLTYGRTQ